MVVVVVGKIIPVAKEIFGFEGGVVVEDEVICGGGCCSEVVLWVDYVRTCMLGCV